MARDGDAPCGGWSGGVYAMGVSPAGGDTTGVENVTCRGLWSGTWEDGGAAEVASTDGGGRGGRLARMLDLPTLDDATTCVAVFD